ncbi:MAG: hypothetical protein KDE56_13185, partial [Anaerolineales bacterium]|nr:hypothetical protein [Anaerolineales bacterium]
RPLTDQRNPTLYRHRETIAPLPVTARILRPFLPGNPETIYQQLQTLHQTHLPIAVPNSVRLTTGQEISCSIKQGL